MILSAHIIAGGVAGELVGDTTMAFVVGFVLHFILDAIPHYDTCDGGCWSKKQIIFTSVDIIFTFVALFSILPINSAIIQSNFAWGAFGGMVPDLLDNVPFWENGFQRTKFGRSFHRFHHGIHQKQPAFLVGMLTQIITIALSLAIYFAIIK